MPVIFVHGNKSIFIITIICFLSLISLFSLKLNEKKMELRKTMVEYEYISTNLNDKNNQFIKELNI